MTRTPLLTVILAAGKGTRMKSALPKVMHPIAGRSMLAHVLALTTAAGCERVAVVVGPNMEAVRHEAERARGDVEVFVQPEQRGTADAVLAAEAALAGHRGDVLVLYADTPLIRPETIAQLVDGLDRGFALSVLGFEAADPTGYGRLLLAVDGSVAAIREDRDANESERAIRLCNSGVLAFRLPDLLGTLHRINADNAKGELYLTDTVAIARTDGHRAAVVRCAETEVLGVNSRAQLAEAEAIWQRRARAAAMAEGVTMIAPDTVYLCHDTLLGRDVTLEPNVVFGPGVVVEDDVRINANCHIEGARIGKGSRIGPFARLRPGADLGAQVHIGNFVEVKNVAMGAGAKANHLAYLGDGTVGPKANVGAGTIFCNYDGFEKSRTEIGEGAFIGSNSSLVAPVRIGEGAYVGSGSVVTEDVPADALALERSPLVSKPGWARKFRQRMAQSRAARETSAGERNGNRD